MFEPVASHPIWPVIRVLGVGVCIMLIIGVCFEIVGSLSTRYVTTDSRHFSGFMSSMRSALFKPKIEFYVDSQADRFS
jgi:nucleoside recognition membrane protein YjiH